MFCFYLFDCSGRKCEINLIVRLLGLVGLQRIVSYPEREREREQEIYLPSQSVTASNVHSIKWQASRYAYLCWPPVTIKINNN